MTTFKIENACSAVVLGTYEAEHEVAALDMLARDAGYTDWDEACGTAPACKDEILVTHYAL